MKTIANSIEEFKEKVKSKEILDSYTLNKIVQNKEIAEQNIKKKKVSKEKKNKFLKKLPKHLRVKEKTKQQTINIKQQKNKISIQENRKPIQKFTGKKLELQYSTEIVNSTLDSIAELIKVEWENIFFIEQGVFIYHNNIKSTNLNVSTFRKSLMFIRPFLILNNISPFHFKIIDNKLIAISNKQEFDTYIKTNLKPIDFELPENISQKLYKSYYKLFEKDKVSNTIKKYKIDSRNKYLKQLCKLHDLDFPIIPVIEPKVSNKKVTGFQETFLFTIKKSQHLIIVWESIQEKNATFLFTVSTSNYKVALQKIFTIICKEETKRNNLKQNKILIKEIDNISAINHGIYSTWFKEIKNLS